MTSPHPSSHPTLLMPRISFLIHNSWPRHCMPKITNERSATATLAVVKACM